MFLEEKLRSFASNLWSIENDRSTADVVGWHSCKEAKVDGATSDREASIIAPTSEFFVMRFLM